MPKGTFSKGSDDQFDYKKKGDDFNVAEAKGKKESKVDVYKCGDIACGKFYHSYTAFYNHCKKSHGGQFPENSFHNNKPFQGPSKNRGRPRIKKNQTKDQAQIQSMKRQNQLIQFLGTIKTKKVEELIVYVQNPLDRLQSSTGIVEDWLQKSHQLTQEKSLYLREIENFNKIIADNDLPEFYDPIESQQYKDKLDSYNFSSIYNFMTNKEKREMFNISFEGNSLLYKILLVWLARILSQKLLSQIIYTVLQIEFGCEQIKEKEILHDKSQRLQQLSQKFFQCFTIEGDQFQKSNN